MVVGAALASPALAADPKPTQVPVVRPEPVAPKVVSIEVPGFPVYPGSPAVFNLIKGQSYKIKVKYSTPALPPFSPHPSPYPHGFVPVASSGVVLVVGGAYQGSVYEFSEKYCLSIPPVKPGDSTVLETPVFQVPRNLTGTQFLMTAKQPAQSCR
jgi:hypothetical protein